jgi:two-component system sensor histidine kinase MprB
VPPSDRERIFERFVRGENTLGKDARPVRGSGIGLSLVKHIAESHGGAITVEAPETGEIVPDSDAAPSRDDQTSAADPAPRRGHQKGATFLLKLPLLDSPLS